MLVQRISHYDKTFQRTLDIIIPALAPATVALDVFKGCILPGTLLLHLSRVESSVAMYIFKMSCKRTGFEPHTLWFTVLRLIHQTTTPPKQMTKTKTVCIHVTHILFDCGFPILLFLDLEMKSSSMSIFKLSFNYFVALIVSPFTFLSF